MLPQSLHIFRKDLRHLWPETLVGIVLLAAFAWSAPYKGVASPFAFYANILDAFLHILIPVAWLVIISRLIHDEPLVGDRQFWTSRPYHWAKLLLAKCLYLLAFIYLPFLLMQVYLLKHAGLYPTTVIPALLHNLLLLTVILIVPLAAIAAVTTTFARMLLAVLGGIIYVIILVAAAGYYSFDRMLPPHINGIAVAVLILLPAIALIYQYARRRTAISRAMLIAAPVVAVLLFFLTPATLLIRSGYPLIPTAGGPRLTPFAIPDNPNATIGRLRVGPHNNAEVALPFQVQGVDKDSAYLVNGIALTIDAPSVHWTSPYMTSPANAGIISAAPFTALPAFVPADIFNKVHASPADLHLSIAAEHLKADKAATWKSSFEPFDIPGHGRCTFSSDEANAAPICRFPFATPKFLFLNTTVSADCTVAGAPSTAGGQRVGGDSATLNFDPVIAVPLEPSTGSPQRRGHLCPGAALNFTQNTSLGNARLEVDAKQVTLDPLAARIPPPQPVNQPGAMPGPGSDQQ